MEHGTVLLLYGPKAVGKSHIARTLAARFSVEHVDPDAVVLEALARGAEPDPTEGWLTPIREVVLAALAPSGGVVTEATGAYVSDWVLGDELQSVGIRVVRVHITAPWEVTRERISARSEDRVAVSPEEARAIFRRSAENTRDRAFALAIDTTKALTEDEITRLFRPLLEPAIDPGGRPAA